MSGLYKNFSQKEQKDSELSQIFLNLRRLLEKNLESLAHTFVWTLSEKQYQFVWIMNPNFSNISPQRVKTTWPKWNNLIQALPGGFFLRKIWVGTPGGLNIPSGFFQLTFHPSNFWMFSIFILLYVLLDCVMYCTVVMQSLYNYLSVTAYLYHGGVGLSQLLMDQEILHLGGWVFCPISSPLFILPTVTAVSTRCRGGGRLCPMDIFAPPSLFAWLPCWRACRVCAARCWCGATPPMRLGCSNLQGGPLHSEGIYPIPAYPSLHLPPRAADLSYRVSVGYRYLNRCIPVIHSCLQHTTDHGETWEQAW